MKQEEGRPTVQSLKQARRLLDELATQGGWKADRYGEYSIVFTRTKGGFCEEMTVVKKADKQWSVVKIEKGGSRA